MIEIQIGTKVKSKRDNGIQFSFDSEYKWIHSLGRNMGQDILGLEPGCLQFFFLITRQLLYIFSLYSPSVLLNLTKHLEHMP